MTRVDLDNIERHIGEPPVDGIRMHPVTDPELLGLVVELRAAREVVEAARRQGGSGAYQATVWAAVVAYDEAVGS
jgi:hypothetical protein